MFPISQIRYNFIKSKIIQFLKNEGLPIRYQFPVNVMAYFDYIPNCKVLTYQQFARKYNMDINSVIQLCDSNSGCTHYSPSMKRHMVLYNDSESGYNVIGRINWTLSHELGHIILGHCSQIEETFIAENNMYSLKNNCFESEADFFAATFLAPFQLFETLNVHSPIDIQNIFGLSVQASIIRWDSYLQWKHYHFKTSFDSDILKIYNLSA